MAVSSPLIKSIDIPVRCRDGAEWRTGLLRGTGRENHRTTSENFSPHYQKKPEAGPDVSHTEQTTSIEIKYPENKGVRHAANIRHRSGL